MSDLVQKLAGALEGVLNRYVGLVESGDAGNWNAETEPEVIEARAALSEAKAGGWVAVPVEMTDEMRDAGNEWICNRFLLGKAYAAMLSARPLPAPPAQRGEG